MYQVIQHDIHVVLSLCFKFYLFKMPAQSAIWCYYDRAPLFEVQTDDWECFRSVLWDPAHADCAVPQVCSL